MVAEVMTEIKYLMLIHELLRGILATLQVIALILLVMAAIQIWQSRRES